MTATSQQLTMRSLFVVFFLVAMILGTVLGGEEDKEGFRKFSNLYFWLQYPRYPGVSGILYPRDPLWVPKI